MALYYDAASILSSEQTSGSLKSLIYSNTTLKSKPTQVYALISETAKRDTLLKEVLDNAKILENEPKLTPLLSLLLCHDHFFAKSGIAAPAKHPLRQAVERHKARLQAEFTRARLRRRCASVVDLKSLLDAEKKGSGKVYPRWARVNTLRAKNVERAVIGIHGSTRQSSLAEVLQETDTISYCHDENIPDLFAFSPNIDLTSTNTYKNGEVILQDKASCFPAQLLLGDQKSEDVGDMIDGCAAPGNKTTHLAAIAQQSGAKGTIYACERDSTRSKTLQSMVAKAGAKQVNVLARQDFLALDPEDRRFANITHLLLDPSCSGSGILRREDIPQLALPHDPRAISEKNGGKASAMSTSKKRKRNGHVDESAPMESTETEASAATDEEAVPVPTTRTRLIKLSNLQTRIVEHAMKFLTAKRITYSTCSIHELENEVAVSRILKSDVAKSAGWRLLRRDEQVEGLKKWKARGVKGGSDIDGNGNEEDGDEDEYTNELDEVQLDACIRCSPDDGEGTMGFFVCAFVRDGDGSPGKDQVQNMHANTEDDGGEQEWEGFD